MVPPVPPPESDEDRRRREMRRREEEDEQEREAKKKKGDYSVQSHQDTNEKLRDMMEQVEAMLPQLDNLYSFYAKGFERRPPLERRKQLDQLIRTMEAMPKNTQTLRYKFSGIQQSYNSHREKWERLLRDIESGKIKRPVRHGGGGTPTGTGGSLS